MIPDVVFSSQESGVRPRVQGTLMLIHLPDALMFSILPLQRACSVPRLPLGTRSGRFFKCFQEKRMWYLIVFFKQIYPFLGFSLEHMFSAVSLWLMV